MTSYELLKCIDAIDDKLIVKVMRSENALSREKIKKYCMRAAGCVAMFVAIVSISTLCLSTIEKYNNIDNRNLYVNNRNQYDDNSIPPIHDFIYDGYIYEVVTQEQAIIERGLPITITDEQIGELLEKDVIETAKGQDGQYHLLGDVYECKQVNDRSVIIIKDKEDNYKYAFKCNKHDTTIY